jgi:hypothetical protein
MKTTGKRDCHFSPETNAFWTMPRIHQFIWTGKREPFHFCLVTGGGEKIRLAVKDRVEEAAV